MKYQTTIKVKFIKLNNNSPTFTRNTFSKPIGSTRTFICNKSGLFIGFFKPLNNRCNLSHVDV